jgi:hypothetical protein
MLQSLCNACGIRQRKARRAMAAAAAAAAASNGGTPQAASVAAQATKASKKEKRADVDRSLPFKKRCKMVAAVDQTVTAAKATPTAVVAEAPTTKDQDHVSTSDDKVAAAAATSLQSKTAACPPPPPPAAPSLHALFPAADEVTDAAMLLMTLSCGLVRS